MSFLKNISLTYIIIALGIIVYLFHFAERDPSDPYQRPIVSDAKGYYAYLPAIFIYQDLQYRFIEEMDTKYYSVGHEKHIFIQQNDRRINKTFPGIALLYMPFFLLAHFFAVVFSLEPDGYSNIYQYMFDFGQFFYATLGLIILAKSLALLNFSKRTILLAVLLLLFGTNLWFYTVYDQSVTHVYNFFLVNLLVYFLLKFQEINRPNYLILILGVLSLILIIRPTGILSLILLVFICPSKAFWKKVFAQLKQLKVITLAIGVSAVLFSIPLILWKIQSGNWIVYSYGEEGFNFSKPEIFNFLFSYAKGWWLYSPLVLVSIVFGGFFIFKSSKIGRIQTYLLVVFLVSSIYVFSSWWCWWYGFSFGQRPMVDFYFIIGFLLAVIIENLQNKRVFQVSLSLVIVPLLFLNLFQSYQHHHGFFQWSKPNAEIYWDNFLRFRKQAKVYVEDSWELIYSEEGIIETISTNVNKPFSESVIISNLDMLNSEFAIVTFNVLATSSLSSTDLVVEYKGDQSSYRNYNFNEFCIESKTVPIQIKYDVHASNDSLVLYFWNKDSGEKMDVDFLKVDFYLNSKD